MKNSERRQPTTTRKIVSIVICVSICVLFVSAFVTLVSNIIKYNEIQKQKEQLAQDIHDCKEDIEELEYWIKAPMDDEYIMKFAREKLELYRADEIVFTNDRQN